MTIDHVQVFDGSTLIKLFENLSGILMHEVTSLHEEDLSQDFKVALKFALIVQSLNKFSASLSMDLSGRNRNTFLYQVLDCKFLKDVLSGGNFFLSLDGISHQIIKCWVSLVISH
jgi:hypothetical protein